MLKAVKNNNNKISVIRIFISILFKFAYILIKCIFVVAHNETLKIVKSALWIMMWKFIVVTRSKTCNIWIFPMFSSIFTICYYVNNYWMLLYSILWSPSCWIFFSFLIFFACSFFILFIRFNMKLHFVHKKSYIIVHEHQLSCLIKSTLLVVDFYYCFFTVIAYSLLNPFSHQSR